MTDDPQETDEASGATDDRSPSVAETDRPTAIRVRGIYTTALTRTLLAADHRIVRASGPIRRRFDESFPVEPEAVRVVTTDDRQGVGVRGEPAAVERLRERLAGVAVDAFSWGDPTPCGAAFDGRVTDTTGGGAVVRLDEVDDDPVEGYLPFDAADGSVEAGDTLRVQVRESAPPWTDDRPELGARLRADGGLATLVRGRTDPRVVGGDSEAARELAGMTDLLEMDTPDGWGIEWARDATDAGLDALRASLDRATARARRLGDAPDDRRPPRRLDEPSGERDTADATDSNAPNGDAPNGDATEAKLTDGEPTGVGGAWVWFGRTARATLDDHRRAVATTIPGHHRIKAGSQRASAGVDFAESVATFDADDEFPFAAVTDQFGPGEGDTVRLVHGKPDGRAFSLGRATVTDVAADGSVTVERELRSSGTYDGLGTRREPGDTAVTKLRENRWWYPTTYRGADGENKGTYVNVCTPVEVFPDAVRYVDLHVDVVRRPDGTVERVDDDELDRAVERGDLSPGLADRARSVAAAVVRALSD